jgi:lipopolysaccharide transport system ATP-binding protein
MDNVIEINGLSKQYRLGEVNSKSVSDDIKRWWNKVRDKEDSFLKIGEVNDRTKKGNSNYVWALNDINLSVSSGEVLGIIGRNGAGKSTLLKILSRTTGPTKGEYKIKGKVTSLLEVGTGFHPELSGRDNVFLNGAILGMKKAEIKQRFDEILHFSGVERYIDTPVKRYSSGMYVRLAFAVAAHLEPDILIVDEVLAVGDQEFQDKCIGKMKDVSGQGRTVLFVSHNMGAVKQLCTRAAYLENGLLVATGSTTEVINKYFVKDDGELSDGIVPRNFKRIYSNGRGYMEFVSTVGFKNEIKRRFFFRESINIFIKIDLLEDIRDLIFSVSVLNDELQKISYVEYPESSSQTLSLAKGAHQITLQLHDSFLPGKYSLSPSFMHYTGEAIDHIEKICEFEVLSDSEDGAHNYKWNEKHGNSYMKIKNVQIKST